LARLALVLRETKNWFSLEAMTVAFEQAAIKVEKAEEFSKLQRAIEQAFAPAEVEQFLKQMDRKGVRIRDIEGVISRRMLDRGTVENSQQLYQALTLSDQALLREFYLSKIEEVATALRRRFKRLYQYY
jgi:hypothetical protein